MKNINNYNIGDIVDIKGSPRHYDSLENKWINSIYNDSYTGSIIEFRIFDGIQTVRLGEDKFTYYELPKIEEPKMYVGIDMAEGLETQVKTIVKDGFITVTEINQIEFGQIVGSIGWAYEVAKRESYVYDYEGCKAVLVNDILMRENNKNKILITNSQELTRLNGWTRKVKTDKEKLNYQLDKLCYDDFDCHNDFMTGVKEKISEVYEVKKIE